MHVSDEHLETVVIGSVQECLVEMLETRGWSIGKLAAAINVSSETIRNWRKGNIREPHFYGVARLHILADRRLQIGVGPSEMRKPCGLSAEQVREIVQDEILQFSQRGLKLAPPPKEEVAHGGWQRNKAAMEYALANIQQSIDKVAEVLADQQADKRRA